MPITLSDLVALVNSETGNTMDRGNADAVGDTTTIEYLISPPQRFVVNNANFIYFKDGVEDATGAMNYETGVYALAGVEDGHELHWEYDYTYWPTSMVETSVQAGLNNIFPSFYNPTTEDVTADGDTTEFTLTTPFADCVTTLGNLVDGKFTGTPRNKYTYYYSGENLIIRFYSAPAAGTVRVHVVARPGFVDDPRNDVETPPDPLWPDMLNVPDRASHPIVSYAAYYLLSQKQAPRIRSDIALATIGGGNLSPRQMNDASNSFYLRHQMQLQNSKLHPWDIR